MFNILKGAFPPLVPIKKIKGNVVLIKKNVLDFNDFNAAVDDRVQELLGQRVSLQLISSHEVDLQEKRGRFGKETCLENWASSINPLKSGESCFQLEFEWEEEIGIPGAFAIRNEHNSEFYLKSLTLQDLPVSGHNCVHFVCNSWVYPARNYKKDRIFFSNKTYLPHETPKGLRKLREEELEILRGDGKGKLREWDRVYDYATYNDLASPEKGSEYLRPILGGSEKYPYPRRGRTGYEPNKTDPKYETRLPLQSSVNVYVPRDERFGHLKMSDFVAYTLKSLGQAAKSTLEGIDASPTEFDKLQDHLDLYEEGDHHVGKSGPGMNFEIFKELFRSDGETPFKFPVPQVIKVDKEAWKTDAEFCRQILAGPNPVVICCLKEFPPKSKLDREKYGDHDSKIEEKHIEENLDGMTVSEAMEKKRLFIVDYHDVLMPYVRRINDTSAKIYASRTLLFLKDDDTLKPLAIELSLPHPNGDALGAISKVYTPAENGVQESIWQLAKAYVTVNDSGYHQLVSHWLQTHAVIEPFVIATNRQLSAVHPIYKLLDPHYRDTMNINALARQTLINAGGIFELTVFPSKYALEMSSVSYKNWKFTEQALPEDLKKRGMAVPDPGSKHGVRLLINDYPYAADGLEIWTAIREWVAEYCSVYYKTDEMVRSDIELQAWWKELREVGHGDLKDEPWWPKMQTREELIQSCTIIIWISSALHACINFGQYPYAGFLPNRPTLSRRFMPEEGTPEYKELESNFELAFMKTLTPQFQTLLGLTLIEVLSRHSTDEIYIGQRESSEWTTEAEALKAFEEFGKQLQQIEEMILQKNQEVCLKNRCGSPSMPYTLLVPSSTGGLTGRGIPNSISI